MKSSMKISFFKNKGESPKKKSLSKTVYQYVPIFEYYLQSIIICLSKSQNKCKKCFLFKKKTVGNIVAHGGWMDDHLPVGDWNTHWHLSMCVDF